MFQILDLIIVCFLCPIGFAPLYILHDPRIILLVFHFLFLTASHLRFSYLSSPGETVYLLHLIMVPFTLLKGTPCFLVNKQCSVYI